jgi:hypothetical protein
MSGANFKKAERTGRNNNIITPAGSSNGRSTGVAELESHEALEEAQLSEDEVVVEELGQDPRIRAREPDEHVVKVELDRLNDSRLRTFFDETEIAELEMKEQVVTGEEKETSYDEAMQGMKADLKERNRQVARERRAKEVKRAKEELKKGTKYDPNRSVSDLSGEEFKEILQEANQEGNSEPERTEELEAMIESINDKYAPMLNEGESEPEISNVEVDELSEGLDAFREYGGAFEDIAEDIEASSELPDTEITTLESGKKLVKTSYPKLCEELKQVDENPDKDGKIVEENGDVITAKVSEGDKF